MLERKGRILEPAGRIWSVLTLSSSLMRTVALIVRASGSARGSGLMLGPRATSTLPPFLGGGMMRSSSMMNLPGASIGGASPHFRGSVISPVRAETAATSGLARYTLSSAVPERPGKLRLKVRREAAPEGGTWPMPMQGPQADSRMRAPDSMRSARAPVRAIMVNTCREPGVTVMLMSGFTFRPLSTAALTERSW